MKIVVCGPLEVLNELTETSAGKTVTRVENAGAFAAISDADAFINFFEHTGAENYPGITTPILINAVSSTRADRGWKENVVRFNGWKGFVARDTWEISGEPQGLNEILGEIGKKYVQLPDQPGFVSPRIVSMIVNEAFFALEEKISTEAEIDIAMKLGTNYPKGPFEWATLIGLPNIHRLLTVLAATDNRYTPAPWLTKKALQL